jgi:glutaredoxin
MKIKKKGIEIFTKTDCVWCVKAKELMRNLGLNYTEYKLGVDYQKEDLQELLGKEKRLTVPQIYVNGYLVGGYEDFAQYAEEVGIMGLQS